MSVSDERQSAGILVRGRPVSASRWSLSEEKVHLSRHTTNASEAWDGAELVQRSTVRVEAGTNPAFKCRRRWRVGSFRGHRDEGSGKCHSPSRSFPVSAENVAGGARAGFESFWIDRSGRSAEREVTLQSAGQRPAGAQRSFRRAESGQLFRPQSGQLVLRKSCKRPSKRYSMANAAAAPQWRARSVRE